MSGLANFEYQEIQGIPVIQVEGELDLSNIDQLDARLDKTLGLSPTAIVLSLERILYLDSTTLHRLSKWSKRTELLVVRPTLPHCRKLFEIAGLDRVLDLFESTETALEKAIQKRPA